MFFKVILHKIGFSSPNFFSTIFAHDWVKEGANCARSIIFLSGLWWTWRHRNLMCPSNETWSITRICININNLADLISSLHAKFYFCYSFWPVIELEQQQLYLHHSKCWWKMYREPHPCGFWWSYSQQFRQLSFMLLGFHLQLQRHFVGWTFYHTPESQNGNKHWGLKIWCATRAPSFP